MKRLTYMSKFSQFLTEAEIEQIGAHAQQKNKQEGISGVLLCIGTLFFQIIEGEDQKIDQLYATMSRDSRHTDIICLQTELDIDQRLFPDWSMNTIQLDKLSGDVVRPIKLLLERIGDTQQIIGKYTQPAVSKIIATGMNPLLIPPRVVEKIVLFTDLVSFTSISDSYPVEEVSELVSKYLNICSSCITDKGGEVTKYIGDSVMAYFNPDQADNAIQACIDSLTAMSSSREGATNESIQKLMYGGFGLSQGAVMEGNIGSEVKMDFTIMGDSVNIAARLESLTRTVGVSLVLSDTVKESTIQGWDFVHLGKFDIKGKNRVTDAYSIDSDQVSNFDAREVIELRLNSAKGARA